MTKKTHSPMHKKATDQWRPYHRELDFEPLPLYLPLYQPDFEDDPRLPKEVEKTSERGVWIVDI